MIKVTHEQGSHDADRKGRMTLPFGKGLDA